MNQQRTLSAYTRTACLEEMASGTLDLLIIGGGVTGAGIALDAAARGLSVGLVEKQDFAAGTSSRSTKLIHGGLRYLKQGDVALVREVGRERAILYRNAPHLVIPEKMLLPIVQNGTYGKLATSVGLWLYDRLAGVKKAERRRMLSRLETISREPLLRRDHLKGSGLYYEYRTDDARLTIEVLKTASRHGARCVNYAEATEFLYHDHKVIGAQVKDVISGRPYAIRAKKIINAAGPWVDQLREKDNSLVGKRLHLTKGVHLVVPYRRLPLRQAIYFDVADGRMIFAIPRDGVTYVGTTDTTYEGDLEQPTVTMHDVTYLLQAVNDMFPTVRLTTDDLSSSWAGLRPLIHEEGKSESELSRKDEIFVSKSGLITIAGGKLTGFRKMAERVVDLVAKQLAVEEQRSFPDCRTDQIVLSGGDFASRASISRFITEHTQRLRPYGIDEREINTLVARYGTNTAIMTDECRKLLKEIADPQKALLIAELHYCLNDEMVMTISDFLIRRTGRLLFERESLDSRLSRYLAHELVMQLGGTSMEVERQVNDFAKEFHTVKTFL